MFAPIRFLILPLLLTTTVAGCVKPSPRAAEPSDDANQPSSTFIESEVTGESVVSKNVKGFSIPSQRLYTFKTCLQDKRTKETIIGHKFEVEGAKNAVVAMDGRSDKSGCVSWSEEVDFNGAADAKFIQLYRTIKGTGIHSGARNLSICINPWEPAGKTARDCKRDPVPEDQKIQADGASNYLKGLNAKGEQSDRYLWINDMRLNNVPNPQGPEPGMIDFSVAMTPKVIRNNVRGDQELLILKNGKFNFQFWLVAKTGNGDQNECFVFGRTPVSKDTDMTSDVLQKEMKMKIDYLSTYGQLELVGIISPKDNEAGIKPFQGLWTLGDHSGLLGMKFAFQKLETYEHPPGSFDAKKYVAQCTEATDGALLEQTRLAMPAPKNIPDFGAKVTDAGNGMVKVVYAAETTARNWNPADQTLATKVDPETKKVVIDYDKHMNQLKGLGNPIVTEDGPAKAINGTVVVQPNGTRSIVPLSADVPADLMRDECIDGRDIPRLFPKDVTATHFKPGPDFLSCINKNLPSGIKRLEKFEFAPAVARVEPIDDPVKTETTNERTITYKVTTVVKNPLANGAIVGDVEFDVLRDDGTTHERVRTNDVGELIFTDKVHHQYFAPERYILKVVTIKHSSGFSKRLALVFNPWDNNGFQFARDIRGMTKQSVARVNLIPRPKSELLLTQFQWGTQVFRYEVDDFLNLKIFKTFNLTLNPRVLRYSSLSDGRNKDEPLRAGIYLMKIAIQKDFKPLDKGPLEYITAVRKLVRVRNGVINEPVEMAFRDFRVLKLRSNLMIELATIDESKMTPQQREHVTFNGELDSLVEPNSGLQARTFIGPVVAYSNGFSASMRPADDLSENVCVTIDCDELKKNQEAQILKELELEHKEAIVADRKNGGGKELQSKTLERLHRYKAQLVIDRKLAEEKKDAREEREKYVGSIKHLTGKTVSDMINRMYTIEKTYRTKIATNASLARFLKESNLEYAAVQNEAAILSQDPQLPKNNQVLRPGRGFSDFVTRLAGINPVLSMRNVGLLKPLNLYVGTVGSSKVTAADTRALLFGGRQMSKADALRMCVFLVEDLILQRKYADEEKLSFFDKNAARAYRNHLNENCVLKVLYPERNEEDVIVREDKLRIFKVVESERRAGNLMAINRGANVSWGYGTSDSWSFSASPTKVLEGALKLAGFKMAEKILDTFGVGYSWSRSNSKNIGAGSSLGSGQTVAVEIREMRLNVSKYERCTTLRFSQSFVEDQFENFRWGLPKTMNVVQKMERMRRGIVVCEGYVDTKPLPMPVDERYYQFSQFMGEEVMNDPTSFENHPYLIETIRGRHDYSRFMRLLEAQPKEMSDIPDHVNVGELPMDMLKSAFTSALPMFPGIYTLESPHIRTLPVERACYTPDSGESAKKDARGNTLPACGTKEATQARR